MPLPDNWSDLFSVQMPPRTTSEQSAPSQMTNEQVRRWETAIGSERVERMRAAPSEAIYSLASCSPLERMVAASILANSSAVDLQVEAAVRSVLWQEQDSTVAASMAGSYARILSVTRLFPYSFSLPYLSLLPQLSPTDEARLFFGAFLGYATKSQYRPLAWKHLSTFATLTSDDRLLR